MTLRTPLLVVLVAALTSCAQYSTVSLRKPEFRPLKATNNVLVEVEQGIRRGLLDKDRRPLQALGELLAAAEKAQLVLRRDPRDLAARDRYNFAVSRIIGTIQKGKLDPWTAPLRVPASGTEYVVSHRPDPRPQRNPALYDFTPADEFDIGGTYVKDRTQKDGLGAPLVAIAKQPRSEFRTDYTIPRIYYGVTAIAQFEPGRRVVISFEDPLQTEDVTLGEHKFPLAADFTVPLAVLLAKENPKKLEIARVLQPEKYAETARLARLQPYDPKKTVVLCIHGLMDSPATWAPLLNTLRADPYIRKHYQFWFYSYPSGYPYPYSAAILRRELDGVLKRYPLERPMILIGHSMGGCISRLMVTDTGDQLWREIFGRTPAQTELSPKSRELLTESLIFQHRPEVGRVIFVAAPLRGSDMATNWMGRIGSMLVRTPSTLASVGTDVLKVASFRQDELKLTRAPNSVDTLAPNNRFVRAINTIPMRSDVKYNVISGDRGKGGNRDKTKPVMSDGIVPYWSSHLPDAQSELVVPSNHSAHQNPAAIQEIRRILKSGQRGLDGLVPRLTYNGTTAKISHTGSSD